VTKGQHQSKS